MVSRSSHPRKSRIDKAKLGYFLHPRNPFRSGEEHSDADHDCEALHCDHVCCTVTCYVAWLLCICTLIAVVLNIRWALVQARTKPPTTPHIPSTYNQRIDRRAFPIVHGGRTKFISSSDVSIRVCSLLNTSTPSFLFILTNNLQYIGRWVASDEVVSPYISRVMEPMYHSILPLSLWTEDRTNEVLSGQLLMWNSIITRQIFQ